MERRLEIGVKRLPEMTQEQLQARSDMLESLVEKIQAAGLKVEEHEWAAGFLLQLAKLPEDEVKKLVKDLETSILPVTEQYSRESFYEEWKSGVGLVMDKYGRPNV